MVSSYSSDKESSKKKMKTKNESKSKESTNAIENLDSNDLTDDLNKLKEDMAWINL